VSLPPDTIAEGVRRHRLLARPAAIKLIRSSMLGESQRGRQALARRFEREACDTAALGSIHTIEVYDFGVTEEGDCPQHPGLPARS
jgi:hypothetical protein